MSQIRIRNVSILFVAFLAFPSQGAQSAPRDLQVIRVGTGPSSKKTPLILDEGFVVISWAPVESSAEYVVSTSISHDFSKSKSVNLQALKCANVAGWHDSDKSFFDCNWYQQGSQRFET